ncbi:replicative DNA helicase [Streptomyces sp. NPDC057557]|uniref:replicative DNA helicase n=1 Tax=Streptomyces sp. NPDC057557 TaxID=3346167 RepID=UPI003681F0B0
MTTEIDTDLWAETAPASPADRFDRMPPNDMDAEASVLGGMMLHPSAVTEVVEIVESADFYKPAHELVFNTITDLFGKGEPVDPITVTNRLRERGELDRAGGINAAFNLVQGTPTAANAGYYAGIVREKSILRGLVRAGTAIAQLGYAGGDANESADAAAVELNNAVQVRDDPDSALLGEDAEAMVEELEEFQRNGKAMGVPTGFADLDALTHGLHPGQMVIIAARPAMGKSTLAVDMLRACTIKHGRPAAMFSLEMGRREVQHRIMSAEARIGLHHIRGGNMTDSDWTRFAQKLPDFTAAPLTIDATPNQTIMQIKARCRKLKQRGGLDLVVIDYLQLLTSGSSRRQENRQQEVSDMSRNVKLMAKELEIPVVVLCQLNRGPEQRTDKKPQVSDLRESGSLEQDADMVILLHREDAYDKESARAGEADLIVGKHRNGPTATITVAFQGHYSRFTDMAQT